MINIKYFFSTLNSIFHILLLSMSLSLTPPIHTSCSNTIIRGTTPTSPATSPHLSQQHRHTGHDTCFSSHLSMQSAWNTCLLYTIIFTSSPSPTSSTHIAHSPCLVVSATTARNFDDTESNDTRSRMVSDSEFDEEEE